TLGERLPGSLQFPLVVGHCVQFCVTPRLPFPLCELRRAKPASATMWAGGVPERSNGAVLKTAGGRKVARGFKSHPRRFARCKCTKSSAHAQPPALHWAFRGEPGPGRYEELRLLFQPGLGEGGLRPKVDKTPARQAYRPHTRRA